MLRGEACPWPTGTPSPARLFASPAPAGPADEPPHLGEAYKTWTRRRAPTVAHSSCRSSYIALSDRGLCRLTSVRAGEAHFVCRIWTSLSQYSALYEAVCARGAPHTACALSAARFKKAASSFGLLRNGEWEASSRSMCGMPAWVAIASWMRGKET